MGAALNDLAYAVNDTIKDPAKFKALNILMQEMINASVVQALQALNDTFGTEDMLPLNVLLSNAIANHGVQEFKANGTFVVPEGIYKIFVTACGGGGGGGGADSSDDDFGGNGGNGGECIIREAFAVAPGQQIAITIGNGGAAGANSGSPTAGSNGGSTVIGSLVTLAGGAGGNFYRRAKAAKKLGGGLGGLGGRHNSSNSLSSEDGTDGVRGMGGLGCGGENAPAGGGGGGGSYGNGGNGATSEAAATAPGYGGGGGGGYALSTSTKPSAGGKGFALIEW